MNAAAQVFVALAGLLHLAIFALESLRFRDPAIWKRFLVASQADADLVRPWAFNQGFYNLFLALGAFGGLVAVWTGRETGAAVALFACACMALAGFVLVLSDRRMARSAALQAGPPLLGLLLAAI